MRIGKYISVGFLIGTLLGAALGVALPETRKEPFAIVIIAVCGTIFGTLVGLLIGMLRRPREERLEANTAETIQRAQEGRGGIGMGLLMMVGAVVWFVVGLLADRIFFYPPVLFVLGLASVVRGLFSKG